MSLFKAFAVWPRSPGSGLIAVIALICWLSIVATLDPAGSYPDLPEGPGLTVDEIFNVEQGVYLLEQARSLGWLNLMPGTSQESYRPENGYNPDHPPLGRWWLGLHHHLTWWLFPPLEPEGYCVTACARTGSATAFALTILLAGCFAAACFGRVAGILTAISLVLMPRLYGHAHLASLESITNLTCTAAVLVVAGWWNGPVTPTRRAAMLAGLILGLAMLTKIQAVLIPIPVAVWALWRWRTKAVIPLLLWGLTGLFVFFTMWPYLWFDPLGHGLEYLGRTTNRATIQVWYLGQKYADKLVPWHYPFVMFGLTVPLILHGFGLLSLFARMKTMNEPARELPPVRPSKLVSDSSVLSTADGDSERRVRDQNDRSRGGLLLACTLFPLIVFAIPGVAVYDGERLFLTCFPLWSIFVGRGGMILWRWLQKSLRSRQAASVVIVALFLFTARPLVTMAPCHLSYYNGLASPLVTGDNTCTLFEADYWGVGVTRALLTNLVQSVPEGATVAVLPTLHQFQADEYRRQSPLLRRHGIKIVEYQPNATFTNEILIFRRKADLPEELNRTIPEHIQAKTMRDGRLLAYFIHHEDLKPEPDK